MSQITINEKDYQAAVDKLLATCIENDGEEHTRQDVEKAFEHTLQEHIDNILEDPGGYCFNSLYLGSDFHGWLRRIERVNKAAPGIKIKDLGI